MRNVSRKKTPRAAKGSGEHEAGQGPGGDLPLALLIKSVHREMTDFAAETLQVEVPPEHAIGLTSDLLVSMADDDDDDDDGLTGDEALGAAGERLVHATFLRLRQALLRAGVSAADVPGDTSMIVVKANGAFDLVSLEELDEDDEDED